MKQPMFIRHDDTDCKLAVPAARGGRRRRCVGQSLRLAPRDVIEVKVYRNPISIHMPRSPKTARDDAAAGIGTDRWQEPEEARDTIRGLLAKD